MNRDAVDVADTCRYSTYITQSSSNYTDREERTGVENFKKTDVVSLKIARCQEEGHQFKRGDGRDVQRPSEGRDGKNKKTAPDNFSQNRVTPEQRRSGSTFGVKRGKNES